jgi:hypothetical protein
LVAALGVLAAAAGCSSSPTTVVIQVSDAQTASLSSVALTVFDPHGLRGSKVVSPAPMPGQLTVQLPDQAIDLRLVVAGAGIVNGVTARSQPHATVTARLALDGVGLPDSDGDGVPDTLDDCPSVPDPDQKSTAGGPPGDACGGGPLLDMTLPGDELGVPLDQAMTAGDLAGTPPADMTTTVSGSLCPGSFLLCDGFESGSISSSTWNTVTTAGGTITVDSTRAYRGTRSLKASNGAGSNAASILEQSTFAPGKAPSHFFVRVFVFVPTSFANPPAAIMLTEQTVSPFKQINLQLDSGGLSAFNDLQAAPGTLGPIGGIVPKNQWVCLEWEIDVPNSTVNVWLNGSTVTQLSSNTQQLSSSPAIGELGFGLLGSTAGDVWLDEIAVDSTRVTCAR